MKLLKCQKRTNKRDVALAVIESRDLVWVSRRVSGLETRFLESRSRRSQVSFRSWSWRILVSVSSSSSRDFA